MKTRHFYTFIFFMSITTYSASFAKNRSFWDALVAFFHLKSTAKERAEQQASIPPLI